MTPELEKKLVDKYVQFFPDIYGDPRYTCMAYGVTVGDGWYSVLEWFCESIEGLRQKNPALCFRFTQIKEKFGLLRINYETPGASLYESQQIHEWSEEAEHLSSELCEKCGTKEGVTLEGKTWWQTLCPACRKKRD